MSDRFKDLDAVALRAHLEIAVEALEKIANTDFRGNRPQESVIAYLALNRLRPFGAKDDTFGERPLMDIAEAKRRRKYASDNMVDPREPGEGAE